MPSPVFFYKYFDFVVASGIPLPELPLAEGELPLFDVRKVGNRPEWLERSDWDWNWQEPGGEIFLSVAREVDRVLLRFPDVLDVEYRMADSLIELFPAKEVLDATIRHLVLDHVLPRLVSYQGRFVLHASGVADSECTILFLGPTGAGKSTLAASFIEDGLGLLTDDCVLLQSSEDGFSAQAAYAGLRLWPDSFAGLKPDEQPEPESHEGGWKRRLDIESMAGGPYKVRGIFILDSPTEGSPGGGVAVHPIEGADALMELLQHGFMLDPGDRDTIERQFLATGDVVEALPLYRLSYPRDFSRLPQVRQIIASTLEDSGSTWAMSWEGLGIS